MNVRIALLAASCALVPRGAAAEPRRPAAVPAPGDHPMKVEVRRLAPTWPEHVQEGPPRDGTPVSLPARDATPIVLWSGAKPAAVLQYGRSNSTSSVEKSVVLVDGDPGRARFPVRWKGWAIPGLTKEFGCVLETDALTTADLDGDGVQELVTSCWSGEVEVRAVSSSRPRKRDVGSGRLGVPSRVRVSGREILVYPVQFATDGKPARPPSVVRVDAARIERIRLGGLPGDAAVRAVVPVARDGARDVDELRAVWASRSGDLFLSRHRPDGSRIAEPRPLDPRLEVVGYGPKPLGASALAALDASEDVLVLVDAVRPDDEVRRVDVSALGKGVSLVGTIDDPAGAKAILAADGGLFAVGEDGSWLARDGGRWVARERPEPFVALPKLGPGERRVGAFAPASPETPEWLVVTTAPPMIRPQSKDELVSAARRFLDPADLAMHEKVAVVSLDDRDPVRDRRMREEAERRGVTRPVTTLDQWRRELPDSYRETVKDAEDDLLRDLRFLLTNPKARAGGNDYRNPAEYAEWIRTVEVPATTTLTLVRPGGVVGRAAVSGEISHELHTELWLPAVSFRSDPEGFTAALALEGAGGAGAPPDPGLYLVRAALPR